MNRQREIEPYWQDEKDWLCIVEFLPNDNPESRLLPHDRPAAFGRFIEAAIEFTDA